MISYRRFLNNDPPGIVEVWNDAAVSRGSFPIRTTMVMDKWVFSKTFFDPEQVIIAEETSESGKKTIVGFSIVGFGPNETLSKINTDIGTTCALMVKQAYRKKGIGKELLKRSEAYLESKGAKRITFGSMNPINPYLFGIYGGANSPGVLKSDELADPFLKSQGYRRAESISVFQRKLDGPLDIVDSRFNFLRRRYDIQLIRVASVGSWWSECVWGILEPVEFRAFDKLTGMPCARAIVWELEGFNWRWNVPAAGILDVQVRPDLRKQGIAKMLLFQILRFLQDQFFGIAELQVRTADPSAVGLCKSLGYEEVDQGYLYVRAGDGDQAIFEQAEKPEKPEKTDGTEKLDGIEKPDVNESTKTESTKTPEENNDKKPNELTGNSESTTTATVSNQEINNTENLTETELLTENVIRQITEKHS